MIDIKLECSALEGVREELLTLAEAFHVVGNTSVAQRLWAQARTLKTMAESLRKKASDCVSEAYSASWQNSINVVHAAMAGAQLERDHQTENTE